MPGRRLSLEEREEIAIGRARGESCQLIASRLGRCRSVIWRELIRNSNRRGEYRALGAHRKATMRAKRPKPHRLDTEPGLLRRIRTLLLEEKYAPMVVSRLLANEGTMISHETIYQAVYQGRFGDPRSVLCRPRFKRQRRTRTGRYPDNLGPYRRLVTRVADVHTEPGHWEGDLLVGHDNRTAVVVMTERQSRRVLLGALPGGRNADHVGEVVTTLLSDIPPHLRQTLCWDQGRELTRWQRIETALGTPIYFCEPHSPWQKPLVEHTNGLLRRWLPRNQPMPTNQHTISTIADKLNAMPRRILNWHTPTQRYHQLVATTT